MQDATLYNFFTPKKRPTIHQRRKSESEQQQAIKKANSKDKKKKKNVQDVLNGTRSLREYFQTVKCVKRQKPQAQEQAQDEDESEIDYDEEEEEEEEVGEDDQELSSDNDVDGKEEEEIECFVIEKEIQTIDLTVDEQEQDKEKKEDEENENNKENERFQLPLERRRLLSTKKVINVKKRVSRNRRTVIKFGMSSGGGSRKKGGAFVESDTTDEELDECKNNTDVEESDNVDKDKTVVYEFHETSLTSLASDAKGGSGQIGLINSQDGLTTSLTPSESGSRQKFTNIQSKEASSKLEIIKESSSNSNSTILDENDKEVQSSVPLKNTKKFKFKKLNKTHTKIDNLDEIISDETEKETSPPKKHKKSLDNEEISANLTTTPKKLENLESTAESSAVFKGPSPPKRKSLEKAPSSPSKRRLLRLISQTSLKDVDGNVNVSDDNPKNNDCAVTVNEEEESSQMNKHNNGRIKNTINSEELSKESQKNLLEKNHGVDEIKLEIGKIAIKSEFRQETSLTDQQDFNLSLKPEISAELKLEVSKKEEFKNSSVDHQPIDENRVSKIGDLLKEISVYDDDNDGEYYVDFFGQISTYSSQSSLEDENLPRNLKDFYKILNYLHKTRQMYYLLDENEMNLLQSYLECEETTRLIVFQMFTRKNCWQRFAKFSRTLSNAAILKTHKVLSEKGFALTNFDGEPIEDLLKMLIVDELKQICKSFRLKLAKGTKPVFIQKLIEHCNKQTTISQEPMSKLLIKRIKEKLGMCVKISPQCKNLLWKIHLLYTYATPDYYQIGDLYNAMYKIATKQIILPTYKVQSDAKVFEGPKEFENFSKACKYAVDIESLPTKDKNAIVKMARTIFAELEGVKKITVKIPAHLQRFHYANKLTGALLNAVGKLGGKFGEEVEKWLLYLLDKRGLSTSRRGEIYNELAKTQQHHLKKIQEALITIKRGLQDLEVDEISREVLSHRYLKLKKHDKTTPVEIKPIKERFEKTVINANARQEQGTGKRLYEHKTDDGDVEYLTVESTAIKHYLQHFDRGIHCEGSIIENLFYLFFYDIIFQQNVEATFLTELQQFPTDLRSKHFVINRMGSVKNRLEQIEFKFTEEELNEFLTNNFNLQFQRGLSIFFRNSLLNGASDYCQIVKCIGRTKLAKIFDRLASNHGLYRAGLPDLFMWNIAQREEDNCKFVEVKGENDTLSTKQIMWLNFLQEIGLKAEVCHVHTIGSKSFERYNNQMMNTKKKKEKSKQ